MEKDCSLSRREARRQDRREAILDVASRSFHEHGYAGTTMSAIAATLGGSKGTLWSYFPSKEALFAAVLDRATMAYRARLAEILDPCGDLESTLRRFCKAFTERVTSADAITLNRLLVGEAGRFPEIGAIFYERALQPTRVLLADFLDGAMRRGLLRRDDPLIAARTLITLCMSGCHQMLLMGQADRCTPARIDQDIDFAMLFFLRAYRGDGAGGSIAAAVMPSPVGRSLPLRL